MGFGTGLRPLARKSSLGKPRLHWQEDSATASARWQFLALGIATAAFLYLNLFRLSGIPLWRAGDQAIFLTNAGRMMRGEVIYRDIFQFNLPGTECLYYMLFRLFGPAAWIASAALVVAGTAITLLVFAICRRVLSGVAAFVPPLLFLVFAIRSQMDATHHWFSMLAVMSALALIAARRTPLRLGAAGALCAVATLFTSSRGVFAIAGVAVFLVWELRPSRELIKALGSLLPPFVVIVGGTMLYLARLVGTKQLVYSTLIFPLRYYSGDTKYNSFAVFWREWSPVWPWQWRSLPLLGHLLLVKMVVPLAILLFIISLLSKTSAYRDSKRGRTTALVGFVCLALVLSVASAPSVPRLNCVAPLGFMLSLAMLQDRAWIGRGTIQAVFALALLLGAVEVIAAQVRWCGIVWTPRGTIAVLEHGHYEQYTWLSRHAKPGDCFFGEPDFNFNLALRNPAPVDWVTPNLYTRPEQVSAVINGLERCRARFVLWTDDLNAPEDAATDPLPPLRRYLREYYFLAKTFPGGIYIWERLP